VISILHVLDRTCDETALQVLSTLCRKSTTDGRRHAVCCIDPARFEAAALHLDRAVMPVHRRLWRFMNWVPHLPRLADQCGATVLHAWGMEAATACSTRLPQLPLVITLLNPEASPDAANWVRSFPTRATVAAGSQIIRARLIAAGVDADRVVVIRGPVDFGAINQAHRDGIRQRVVGQARPVLLMSGPASRGGGQYEGLWAAAIVQKVHPDLNVILPFDSPERHRLVRFVRRIDAPSLLTIPDPRLTWPELAACADAFVMPAVSEVCTEPLGVAMAARLVVVGVAVRSVAEIIADRSNGLLCKRADVKLLASRILTALEDAPLRDRLTETARGQAYEVFGVRAFIDNYHQLYENVLAGRQAAQEVSDTAMVA